MEPSKRANEEKGLKMGADRGQHKVVKDDTFW
jgi:hypothetical protein